MTLVQTAFRLAFVPLLSVLPLAGITIRFEGEAPSLGPAAPERIGAAADFVSGGGVLAVRGDGQEWAYDLLVNGSGWRG